jgi:hypothetical protein
MRFGPRMHMQLDVNLDLDAIGREEGKAMVATRFREWRMLACRCVSHASLPPARYLKYRLWHGMAWRTTHAMRGCGLCSWLRWVKLAARESRAPLPASMEAVSEAESEWRAAAGVGAR